MKDNETNSSKTKNQPFKILGAPVKLVLDPVCGMRVDPQKAAATVDYQGKKYYFCCRSCADRFSAAPEPFLAPDRAVKPDMDRAPAPPGAGSTLTRGGSR